MTMTRCHKSVWRCMQLVVSSSACQPWRQLTTELMALLPHVTQHIHRVPKKEVTKLFEITFSTDFQNFFTAVKRMKLATKPRNIFHHTLSMFSHYLGKFNTTTPKHTGHATLQLLEQATPAFIPPDLWPVNSSPVDYGIWSVVQQRVYQSQVHDTDKLKQCVQQVRRNVDQSIIDSAIDEWHKHLRACVQANFKHFEHIRGAIKKFSAWPSSVQNKIKILFASYSSKA